jgi:catechol 2,3-dioxygenase-like lactoylglutathione lyase family enzyme
MAQITFDHCVIHVGDWARSTAFYRDVLGAEIVPHGKGAMFRFGPVQLNTHGPDQIGTPRAAVPVMPGNSDICFEWHGDIAGASAHLSRHGVAVELGPVERKGAKGAGNSLYFRDPDGSLLEFIVYGKA